MVDGCVQAQAQGIDGQDSLEYVQVHVTVEGRGEKHVAKRLADRDEWGPLGNSKVDDDVPCTQHGGIGMWETETWRVCTQSHSTVALGS